jgi:hypothetical protein
MKNLIDLSKKKSSFCDLEFVSNVMSNRGISLKNWNWFSNSANNKGLLSWKDIDLINFKSHWNRDVLDCLTFEKIEVINFR